MVCFWILFSCVWQSPHLTLCRYLDLLIDFSYALMLLLSVCCGLFQFQKSTNFLKTLKSSCAAGSCSHFLLYSTGFLIRAHNCFWWEPITCKSIPKCSILSKVSSVIAYFSRRWTPEFCCLSAVGSLISP